jgi:hypothetical protein
MKDLLDLLHFLVCHDNVIVYGNLGRNPATVFEMLSSDPHLNAVIRSLHYPCPSTSDNRIRACHKVDLCDMFVLLEPGYDELVEKPPQATRWVIFTSHLTFKGRPETVWTRVCYFHAHHVGNLARDTQYLLKLQKPSLETNQVQRIKTDALHRIIVTGASEKPLTTPHTFVVIDLTLYFDTLKMSLALWDAFDYMLSYKDVVQGWLICFPSSGRNAFEQFIQHCMDRLFCTTFEHGNVISMKQIATLIPYYTSGCIEETFQVTKCHLYSIPYIAPTLSADVCKAATQYNLEHWGKNVYRIKQ